MTARAECDRGSCAAVAVVRVKFRTGLGARWWYYCRDHAWPLDEAEMIWGARGKRARPMPIAEVEHLT